ncbi:hypothetical protein [Gordonia rhizosphera]|uniref:Uncharacterized protein n=1 Tax=Gordonia rhizosphera NBRC 16068 TaxID=1108045 RepID=K6WH27_9ACTN|nr:hypothetical protein [Gordonia rhizosphera]GAB93091.1 hypothetical protein GORHZ_205_00330 [Gordonia rhizosphera NBRC 16068]
MTTIDPDLPELDIVTAHGTVTRLPTSFPIIDPELDGHLDPDLFQKGFEDGNARLLTLPPAWARHHASSILACAPDPHDDEPSYTRGYRAALYGHLRHARD